ncbi:hypothetical protein N7493_011253 [Penicillium malachiteum]|uniref:Glycosyl transferase family 25 domain-containing protein n=1 Tax=Penicillium malachiteum TaxID=1324776 RepID=A0AAD6HBT2_9EURO|nr:hypothetical protein N7493_011253 [Penicillium malachiteum]
MNSTLGFEKIFYISLPQCVHTGKSSNFCSIASRIWIFQVAFADQITLIHSHISRTDRQDAMALIAAASGLSLTREHGVYGSLIHEKARPYGSHYLRNEQLGCWRAHANIWRKIISENIETALILEDDVDWDINIRSVFAELSRQMSLQTDFKHLTPKWDRGQVHMNTFQRKGSGWDILYVGSSSNIPNLNNLPPRYIYQDPEAPEYDKVGRQYRLELEIWGVNTSEQTNSRVVAPSWYPVGALGYAVTRSGAQTLLYNLGGYNGLQSPVDLAMISLIQNGILDAYTVIPPLITPFWVGGARDSDINEEKYMEEGTERALGSENLRNSARLALAELIKH